MKTRQGYGYFIEDGKYSIDGYEFFDTLEELEADIDWQVLWCAGKAHKDNDGKWIVMAISSNLTWTNQKPTSEASSLDT